LKISSTSEISAATPRYLQLANLLIAEIRDGKYPVGSKLPGEIDIASSAGVARQTVREAIRCLLDRGLVVRRPGVGTIVKSLGSPARYVQSVGDISELFQQADLQRYTRETVLTLTARQDLRASGPLAELLQSKPGRAWVHVSGLRHVQDTDQPLASVEIYLPASFAAVIPQIGKAKIPIYSLIEQEFGTEVYAVQQNLRAASCDANLAASLQIKENAPVLEVTRHYLSKDREVVEVTVSTYPADRFTYSLTLERDVSFKG
jgi:GntR family transcriptional regulator